MRSSKMNWRMAAVLALGALLPGRGYAWLLQPTYTPPGAAAELQTFRNASAQMLNAFAGLDSEFSRAEREHVALSKEVLQSVATAISSAADGYRKAADAKLAQVQLDPKVLPFQSKALADDFRSAAPYLAGHFPIENGVPQLASAADFANALAVVASGISDSLKVLAGERFGPAEPMNLKARELVSSIAIRMSIFIRLANAGAAAIGASK